MHTLHGGTSTAYQYYTYHAIGVLHTIPGVPTHYTLRSSVKY